MSESNIEFVKIVQYMRAHWPSSVREEWQVGMEQYGEILKKVLKDFAEGKSRGRELVRIAGLSGSGKTTQVLPAVEAYFEKKGARPVLVAARRFVKYHPHCEEIRNFYGEENLRKMTDEFSTIMMFLTLGKLMSEGFDIILDVTLLDPQMEEILVKMMRENGYSGMVAMVAVAPEITEKFLGERAWRHTRETELEFIRATNLAMRFYAENYGEMRCVIWNTYEEKPVYDGAIRGALESFEKYSGIVEIPEYDIDDLREAKIKYLAG